MFQSWKKHFRVLSKIQYCLSQLHLHQWNRNILFKEHINLGTTTAKVHLKLICCTNALVKKNRHTCLIFNHLLLYSFVKLSYRLFPLTYDHWIPFKSPETEVLPFFVTLSKHKVIVVNYFQVFNEIKVNQ